MFWQGHKKEDYRTVKTLFLSLIICLLGGSVMSASITTKEGKPVDMGETITLLKPDLNSTAGLMQALSKRQSDREYTSESLTLEQVSEILWAAAGVNRDNGKRTAPSALALYPITVYAVFADGIYKYEPDSHKLTLAARGDHRDASAMQDFAFVAPLNLLFIADFDKYKAHAQISAEMRKMLCGQDAACMAENVCLYAAGNGLKNVVRGSVKWDKVYDVLKLDTNRYCGVLAQTIGK